MAAMELFGQCLTRSGDWKPEDLLEIDMFEFIGNREKTRFWSGLMVA